LISSALFLLPVLIRRGWMFKNEGHRGQSCTFDRSKVVKEKNDRGQLAAFVTYS